MVIIDLVPFLAAFALQLFCCRRVKNKYLRHSGLIISLYSLVTAVTSFFSDPGFFSGGNAVVAMLYLYCFAFSLAGYAAAWGINRLINRRRKKVIISMIAAVGKNGELGKDNGLLWRLDGDLPFFKRVTMGKSVIMGRKTFESLPKALPGRKNIVITSNESFEAEGVKRASSPEEALKMCEGEEEVFIIGGGRIYSEFIGMADKLYLTEAEAEDDTADTFFPAFNPDEWDRSVIDEGGTDIKYKHVLYERKKNAY